MGQLYIVTKGEPPRTVLLSGLNTLGRHPSQSIQLLDKLVSKAHAAIVEREGRYFVRDVGSRNGTLLNDHALEGEKPLVSGDELALGDTVCRYTDQAALRAENMPRVNISSADIFQGGLQQKLAHETAAEFRPVAELTNHEQLQADYERLRLSHELRKELANELEQDRILEKILEYLLEQMGVERGAFLLVDDEGNMVPRMSRSKEGGGEDGQVEELSISQTILQTVVEEKSAVISNDAQLDSRFQGAQSIIVQGIRSTMCVPLLTSSQEVMGVIHLDNRIESGAFQERDLSIVQGLADQAAMAIENTRLVEEAKGAALSRQSFERLLSPNLVEKVLSGELAVNRGGELRSVTVLFSDIRGFTQMSEDQPAPEIVKLLNEYFEVMVEVVFSNFGTLDKFMGDGLMAIWGAPVAGSDDAYFAIRAALEMKTELARLNEQRILRGEQSLEIGIGIDTGTIVAGYLGSTKTMSYTVVGSAVNRAARLCGIASPGDILVSDAALQAAGAQRIQVETREAVQLKGIREPFGLSHVYGLSAGSEPDESNS